MKLRPQPWGCVARSPTRLLLPRHEAGSPASATSRCWAEMRYTKMMYSCDNGQSANWIFFMWVNVNQGQNPLRFLSWPVFTDSFVSPWGCQMSDLYWLTDEQMARLKPFFPVSHGVPRVDDRRVLSGIIFINRNGLRWRDAPAEYGPHKTLYNRWFRWSQMGVFALILQELVKQDAETEMIMIDATHLKAHRTASSLRKKRGATDPFGKTRCLGIEHQTTP